MRRIDEIIVTVLVREYDEAGFPLGELQAQPVKLFRAAVPDVWARLDEELKKLEQESN